MRTETILITEQDMTALTRLIEGSQRTGRDQEHFESLAAELDRAEVVPDTQMPEDVVTVGATVRVLDLKSDEERTYTLAFGTQAGTGANRISVLAPIGTALLGYRQGDEIEWPVPGGVKRLRILEVSRPSSAKGVLG